MSDEMMEERIRDLESSNDELWAVIEKILTYIELKKLQESAKSVGGEE